jgi:hypothetical protein
VASGPTVARDIFFYLSVLIYLKNYSLLKKKTKYIFNILIIFYIFFSFLINIYNLSQDNSNNFIVNKPVNSNLQNSLKDFKLKKDQFVKIYLSPKIYEDIQNQKLKSDGIFSFTDFVDYNLSPFQGRFKNISFSGFGDETRLMYGLIKSHYHLINSELFLDIYSINFLILKKSELIFLNNTNWKLKKNIFTSKKEEFFIFERETSNLYLDDLHNFKNSFNKCMIISNVKIDCILENSFFFKKSPHKFKRNSNGNFEIVNNIDNKYLILPFVFDKNWTSKNGITFDIGNFLMVYKSNESKSNIYYFDSLRFILRSISLITFFSLLALLFIPKKNNNN